ncbi:MAG: 3-keto-disaccharide hydrolase [Planctomycetota bacterium]
MLKLAKRPVVGSPLSSFRLLLVCSTGSLAFAACTAQNQSYRPPKGFRSLFNGKDLTGWKRHDNLPGHGLAGKWFVEDGAIVGMQDPPGKGGFLTTLRKFRNFELLLETKIDWPFDSGLFLRVGPDGKSHQVTLDYRPGGEIGGIYCPWAQGFVHHCPDGIKYFEKDPFASGSTAPSSPTSRTPPKPPQESPRKAQFASRFTPAEKATKNQRPASVASTSANCPRNRLFSTGNRWPTVDLWMHLSWPVPPRGGGLRSASCKKFRKFSCSEYKKRPKGFYGSSEKERFECLLRGLP